MDEKLIEWAESAGLENLRYHLKSADYLVKEANTTLTLFLAGAGGALGFAFKGLDAGSSQTTISYLMFALSLYLFFLCGLLVFKCIWIGAMPMPTNDPKNLYQPTFSIAQIKQVELRNIQDRIDQAVERNSKTARWLNKIRASAIIGTPLIALSFFWQAAARLFG